MEIQDLKALVELDEETRKNVEDAHQKKLDLKKAIADEKQKIKDESWAEVMNLVDRKKIEIDESIKAAGAKNHEDLINGSKNLNDVFTANKEKWLKEIVDRCLS